MDIDIMRRQLLERVSENYADYRVELLQKDRQELIDGADRIARTAEVFRYFTEGWLKEAEIEYFLKFQNPLEVAADHWADCDLEMGALEAVMADAVDRADDLTLYPLAADAAAEKPSGLRKFMNVDLEVVLSQIMAQITAFHQKDLTYALDEMRECVATDDPATFPCRRPSILP